jgi:hypothetical protein
MFAHAGQYGCDHGTERRRAMRQRKASGENEACLQAAPPSDFRKQKSPPPSLARASRLSR